MALSPADVRLDHFDEKSVIRLENEIDLALRGEASEVEVNFYTHENSTYMSARINFPGRWIIPDSVKKEIYRRYAASGWVVDSNKHFHRDGQSFNIRAKGILDD